MSRLDFDSDVISRAGLGDLRSLGADSDPATPRQAQASEIRATDNPLRTVDRQPGTTDRRRRQRGGDSGQVGTSDFAGSRLDRSGTVGGHGGRPVRGGAGILRPRCRGTIGGEEIPWRVRNGTFLPRTVEYGTGGRDLEGACGALLGLYLAQVGFNTAALKSQLDVCYHRPVNGYPLVRTPLRTRRICRSTRLSRGQL